MTQRYLSGHGELYAVLNNAEKGLEEGVTPVGAVETMVAVGPGDDKSDRVELSQLVLDRVKGETTHVHQLAYVAMLLWFREKQPQKLGSHPGKQDIKNRLFRTHGGFVNLTALSRQVFPSGLRNGAWAG